MTRLSSLSRLSLSPFLFCTSDVNNWLSPLLDKTTVEEESGVVRQQDYWILGQYPGDLGSAVRAAGPPWVWVTRSSIRLPPIISRPRLIGQVNLLEPSSSGFG